MAKYDFSNYNFSKRVCDTLNHSILNNDNYLPFTQSLSSSINDRSTFMRVANSMLRQILDKNIPVMWSNKNSTTGDVIYLDSDVINYDVCSYSLLQGLLLHEIAHNKYTDFSRLDEYADNFRLFNILEDRRIEYRLAAEYPYWGHLLVMLDAIFTRGDSPGGSIDDRVFKRLFLKPQLKLGIEDIDDILDEFTERIKRFDDDASDWAYRQLMGASKDSPWQAKPESDPLALVSPLKRNGGVIPSIQTDLGVKDRDVLDVVDQVEGKDIRGGDRSVTQALDSVESNIRDIRSGKNGIRDGFKSTADYDTGDAHFYDPGDMTQYLEYGKKLGKRLAVKFVNQMETVDQLTYHLDEGEIDESELPFAFCPGQSVFMDEMRVIRPGIEFVILADYSGSMRWFADGESADAMNEVFDLNLNKLNTSFHYQAAMVTALVEAFRPYHHVHIQAYGCNQSAMINLLDKDGKIVTDWICPNMGDNVETRAIPYILSRFDESGRDCRKIIVFISDGGLERRVSGIVREAKKRGVEFIALGLGRSSTEELERIFGNATNVAPTEDIDSLLSTLIESINDKICHSNVTQVNKI